MQNAALLWHVSLLVPPDKKGLALGLVGLVRVGPDHRLFDDQRRGRRRVGSPQADALHADRLRHRRPGAGLADVPRRVGRVADLRAGRALGAAVGAFDLPARQALLPTLVPREHLPNAISLNTTMMQTASVAGPALGGLMIAATSVGWAYVVNAHVVRLRDRGAADDAERAAARSVRQPTRDDVSLHAALEGLRFVFRSPLIRSTMLLDFFATFFSSATALLPIFAQDILQVGAKGYGWLYAAPAVGALITSAALVPLTERIERRGVTLLWAVAGYGLATVVFGLSRSFWLTFALPGAHRRDRHGEHGHPQHRPAARDARSPPRAHDRRQHGVLHGRAAARRARSRRGRQLARRDVFGRQRRHRVPVATAWIAATTPMIRTGDNEGTRRKIANGDTEQRRSPKLKTSVSALLNPCSVLTYLLAASSAFRRRETSSSAVSPTWVRSPPVSTPMTSPGCARPSKWGLGSRALPDDVLSFATTCSRSALASRVVPRDIGGYSAPGVTVGLTHPVRQEEAPHATSRGCDNPIDPTRRRMVQVTNTRADARDSAGLTRLIIEAFPIGIGQLLKLSLIEAREPFDTVARESSPDSASRSASNRECPTGNRKCLDLNQPPASTTM